MECPLALLRVVCLHSLLSWAWCWAASRLNPESWQSQIWSFHLRGGRPGGHGKVKSLVWTCIGRHSCGIRTTCPNHFRRRLDISSFIVLEIFNDFLMSTLLILSRRWTPAIVRRHLISKSFQFISVSFP